MAAVANFDSDAFQLYLGKPKDFLLTEAKPQAVRACKVAWRSDALELVVVQADEQCCIEANGQLARMPVGPAVQAAAASAPRATTRPSSRCRWSSPCSARAAVVSSRGGPSYCGTCGTPVAGAAAPLELVLADETRVPLVGDMTIGRAPGSTRRARRPERLARARAHLARRQRRRRPHRGRGLERRARSSTASRSPRPPRCTTARSCSSARWSCASSAAATRPRRAARSSCARARASSCPRSGRPAWPAATRRRSG